MGDGQVVIKEVVNTIMTPEGGHLAQQHVILVVLAHGQSCHLHHQELIWSVNYTVTYMARTHHHCRSCIHSKCSQLFTPIASVGTHPT